VIRVAARAELERVLGERRSDGRSVALVPTMGFLHEGHLSLIDIADREADLTVVSIFVNPIQFAPGEDLDRYPRDIERDASLAAGRAAAVLFVPAVAEMYPGGDPGVVVDAPLLAGRLCGAFRPGHFQGVLTVVAKLFNMVRPDVAVFGRKDYQQLTLIRAMVRDLNMPVRIVAGPIVREPDGLALSSRNVYLDEDERSQATLLHQGLLDAEEAFARGVTDAATLVGIVQDRLSRGSRVRTQYVELVNGESLAPVEQATPGTVLAIAAHVGNTRLIDNLVIGGRP